MCPQHNVNLFEIVQAARENLVQALRRALTLFKHPFVIKQQCAMLWPVRPVTAQHLRPARISLTLSRHSVGWQYVGHWRLVDPGVISPIVNGAAVAQIHH